MKIVCAEADTTKGLQRLQTIKMKSLALWYIKALCMISYYIVFTCNTRTFINSLQSIVHICEKLINAAAPLIG